MQDLGNQVTKTFTNVSAHMKALQETSS